MINNELTTVPAAALQALESYIPFGSDYVIFTESYSNYNRTYTAYYKPIAQSDYSVVKVNYHYVTGGGSYYSVDTEYNNIDWDGDIEYPYYSYSNIKGCGSYISLSSTESLMCLMLVVVCCLTILRTVFGGIKLWNERRKY